MRGTTSSRPTPASLPPRRARAATRRRSSRGRRAPLQRAPARRGRSAPRPVRPCAALRCASARPSTSARRARREARWRGSRRARRRAASRWPRPRSSGACAEARRVECDRADADCDARPTAPPTRPTSTDSASARRTSTEIVAPRVRRSAWSRRRRSAPAPAIAPVSSTASSARAGRGRGTPRGRTGCRRAPLERAREVVPDRGAPRRARLEVPGQAERPRVGADGSRGSAARARFACTCRRISAGWRRASSPNSARQRATGTISTLSGTGAGVEVDAVPTGDSSCSGAAKSMTPSTRTRASGIPARPTEMRSADADSEVRRHLLGDQDARAGADELAQLSGECRSVVAGHAQHEPRARRRRRAVRRCLVSRRLRVEHRQRRAHARKRAHLAQHAPRATSAALPGPASRAALARALGRSSRRSSPPGTSRSRRSARRRRRCRARLPRGGRGVGDQACQPAQRHAAGTWASASRTPSTTGQRCSKRPAMDTSCVATTSAAPVASAQSSSTSSTRSPLA